MFAGCDRQCLRFVAMIGFAAILIYVSLIRWGLPHATAPDRVQTFAVDELLPLSALAEMHNTFVVSKPDRSYGYPWWHYFVLAAWQTPYVVYLKLTHQMETPDTVFPFGLKDPVGNLEALTLVGRFLSVLMGAGIVIAAYFFARTLWNHQTGTLAACLTMISYPQVYYSRLGNVDVALVFWSGIGLIFFAKILREGLTTSRAAWLGIFAGVAMATKDQGLVIFLPLGAMLLIKRFQASPRGEYQLRALVYGLLAAVVSYFVTTGMVVDPQRHILHTYFLFFAPERLTSMPFYHQAIPRTLEGVLEMFRESFAGMNAMISLPVLLAALVGGFRTWRVNPRYLVLLLPIPVLFLILTLPTGFIVYRYYYPLTFILDAFAACAVMWLGETQGRRAWMIAFLVLFGWRALIVSDLSYVQSHETRTTSSDWFRANAKPGDRIEFFGNAQLMPHLPAEIASRRIAGRETWRWESGHGAYLLDYMKREGPRFIYVTPDQTSDPGMVRSRDCPPEVYQALEDGSAGYQLAAYFPTPTLLPGFLHRPHLDHSLSPPVRIFMRRAGEPAAASASEKKNSGARSQ